MAVREFRIPLSIISPQEPGDHQNRGPKSAPSPSFSGFWVDFLLFQNALQNFEKTWKKMGKSRILVSHTPPKTLPKSYQNRGPKKHAIFHQFWLEFWCLLQEPTSKKRAPTQCFVNFSHNSLHRLLRAFSVQKTYRKPFQNDVRTLPKSMPKTCCFSTSIFSGFGLNFGGSWASKLEPSWLL